MFLKHTLIIPFLKYFIEKYKNYQKFDFFIIIISEIVIKKNPVNVMEN